jgi:ATP-dependent RNA helicase DDX52/ROK1
LPPIDSHLFTFIFLYYIVFIENKKKLKLDFFGDEDEEEGHTAGENDETSNTSQTSISASATGGGNIYGKIVNSSTDSEEINEFRNRLKIKVRGNKVPNPVSTFAEMKISSKIKSVLLGNIEKSQWKEPTPIQMQSIPAQLLGRDVMASAPTGSGKTAAYLIPMLSQVAEIESRQGISAILLAPTKELADQIYREALRLSFGKKIRICSLNKSAVSSAINQQKKDGFSNYDVVVSTPMRLLSVIKAEVIDLSNVSMFILDEVDRLFDVDSGSSSAHASGEAEENEDNATPETRSSFLTQIDAIIQACPADSLQKVLFSATIGPFVQDLAGNILKDPIVVSVGLENSGASTINQRLVFVGREEGKLLAIRQIIQEGLKPPVLLFLQSKERAKELYKELVFDGINVDVIHSERTAQQREEIIKRFRRGDIWVLICTDLMARGVDFKAVKMVINYDLPQSAVSYIHRIGRTGRAGRHGEAVTFFTEADIPLIRPIANVVKISGCDVPDWLLAVKQLSTKEKRKLRKKAPERRTISTALKTDANVAKKKNMIKQSKQKKMKSSGDE